MSHTEVAVIGGGPSGSILGALLAKQGFETTIYDRSTFPRKKLCGEFIAPGGTSALQRLNLLEPLKEAGGTLIDQFSITTRRGATLEHQLHGPGLSLSRQRLDVLLLQHASDCGATVRTNARVSNVGSHFAGDRPAHTFQVVSERDEENKQTSVTTELLLGAYGRRTKLDRTLNRGFFDDRSPYVGFQRHHRFSSPDQSMPRRVELYLVPGGYCGLVRIERNRVNVCMLTHQDALPGGAPDWRSIRKQVLSENSNLSDRLRQLVPAEEGMRSVAQVPLQTKKPVRTPCIFTGDATGMIAPLTGNGQASAIRSSIALANLIEQHGIPQTRSAFHQFGKRWSARWKKEFGGQVALGQLLNKLLQYESLASTAVRGLKHVPALTSFLEKYITSRREQT